MLHLSGDASPVAPASSPLASMRQRVLTQLALRLTTAVVLLATATLIELRAPDTFPFEVVIAVLGLVFVISLLFIATLGWVETCPWLADVHVVSDALVISMLVATTGGITSLFTPLYFLPILATSSVRLRRGALEIAALSAVLYCGIVLLHYLAASALVMLPPLLTPRAGLPPGDVALYTVGLNVFSFGAVALLSGALAERWRRADLQLVHTSKKLAGVEAFNDFVVDHLPSGLATADADNRILTFNRAAAAITGVEPEAAIGAHTGWLLQLDAAALAKLAQDEPGAMVRRLDMTFRRADGSTIEVGVSATRLAFPDGPLGYLYTFQDVTEVKRLEREARTRQRLAALGEMAAGISHEIRNPLASMSGSLQLLRQELPLSDDQALLLDIVLKESDRLHQTIRSFLTYARPERVVIGPVDLRTTISEAVTLLRHSPDRDERHALLVSTPDEPVVVEADEGQIKQIVWNLATNGLRAMPSGGRLLLSAAWNGQDEATRHAVLAVNDEGVGIAEQEIERIFQPFSGSFAQGSGLGLAIVYRIVSEHGATIAVESAPSRGTTFLITFPRAAEAAPAPPAPTTVSPAP